MGFAMSGRRLNVSRREALFGAASASLFIATKAGATGGGSRPFDLEDGFRHTDVQAIIGNADGSRWALTVNALPERGRFGAVNGDITAYSRIWLADARLANLQVLTAGDSWGWTPAFSPGGDGLAYVVTMDGAVQKLGHARAGGEPRVLDVRITKEVSFGGGEGRPFLWIDSQTLLFVQDLTRPYVPELNASALPGHRASVTRRLAEGESSVLVWNAQSPTCGISNQLCAADVMTGTVTSLFAGDVRGVSPSPDGRRLALWVATTHLDPGNLGVIDMPTHRNPFNDALVRSRLVVLNRATGNRVEIPEINTVGVISDRELAIWALDGKSLSFFTRDAYDAQRARYRACRLNLETGVVESSGASTQLDGEVAAHLLTLARDRGAPWSIVEERPQFRDDPALYMAASYVRRMAGSLFVNDGARCYRITPGRAVLDLTDQAPPAPPTLLGDGSLLAIGQRKNGKLERWRLHGSTVTSQLIGDIPRSANPALMHICANGRAMIMGTASQGTSFWSVGAGRPSEAALHLNDYLRDVTQPISQMLDYRNGIGEPRSGLLIAPTRTRFGAKPPVVLWAYPGYRPRSGGSGSLAQLNSQLSWLYPFQLLLAEGYAVFWADLPESGEGPRDRILAEILPCIDMLRARDDVDGNRAGFYGHSNAGFVGLTLAAHTRSFGAIAISSSFPDWAATDVAGSPQQNDMPCGAFVQQQFRYLAEGRGMPYTLHAPRWQARDAYLYNSPIEYLQNLRTPLLLLDGELDASPNEMREAYLIAQTTGTPVEFAFYAGEQHVLSQRANIRDAHMRVLHWFERYL